MTERTLYEADESSSMIAVGVSEGWLVKVEPCKHGNYAPHLVVGWGNRAHMIECDGKPEADELGDPPPRSEALLGKPEANDDLEG